MFGQSVVPNVYAGAAAFNPVRAYTSGAAPGKASAAGTTVKSTAKSNASVKRARQAAERQTMAPTEAGARNLYVDVVRREWREYAKYC